MRKWLLLAVALLVLGYVAYPYVTLYRIDRAVYARDVETLEALIDWPALRQSLKTEVKSTIVASARSPANDEQAAKMIGAALAALLAPAVVDNAVDALVTPANLADNPKTEEMREEGKSPLNLVGYAFFQDPTTFRIDLRDPDEPNAPTFIALMQLRQGIWKVTALKMPEDVVQALTTGLDTTGSPAP